jgi:trk system potassium uptake protein TrkA
MDVVICGAGTVGTHAAEVLAGAGHNITVVEARLDRLSEIEDALDVRTLQGNCTYAEVLRQAGAAGADMVIAATNLDEINLLAAATAKGVGAARVIARVRHSAYFDERGVDYTAVLGIDRFICPEYSTALAIASSLRNPGALAIENFARGEIEMQEVQVADKAHATGRTLADLTMPPGTRLAALERGGQALVPEARTAIRSGDKVVIVGNRAAFQEARKLFATEAGVGRRVVIMGGSPMAVWLCRALRGRNFQIRLFEIDRPRAEELADKLPWITVINDDPTDPSVFEEEHIEDADAFVSLRTEDDEHNILAGAWAKSMGARLAIASVQRPNYLHLMSRVGIDKPFSPRAVAVREIEDLLADRRLHRLATLAEGAIDVYQLAVDKKASVAGKPLREIKITPDWMIAAVERNNAVKVPGADDTIEPGDTVLVIGRSGEEAKLKRLFSGKRKG